MLSKTSGLDPHELDHFVSKVSGQLKEEMQTCITHANTRETIEDPSGFVLYLSGGGFRGWGHLLMSHEKRNYPVPIINGYCVDPVALFSSASSSQAQDGPSSHRVSKRRASQFPAVQVIIKALLETKVGFSSVVFCQGGVREGLLYKDLPLSVRALAPLQAATLKYAPVSANILHIFFQTISPPEHISQPLLLAVVNMLYAHGPVPKDLRAISALRSTTVGLLASAHGTDHRDRAMLALILCERWGGKIPASENEFYDVGHLLESQSLCAMVKSHTDVILLTGSIRHMWAPITLVG